ncbi:MAG: hypothetical protein IJS65_01440, partial [Clostridia bacterium]|nr:hypothetical protein [Clostridia bacterium]
HCAAARKAPQKKKSGRGTLILILIIIAVFAALFIYHNSQKPDGEKAAEKSEALEIDGAENPGRDRSEASESLSEVLAQAAEIRENALKELKESGVPYVGMPESLMGETALGKPSSYVHEDTEMIKGVAHYAYEYSFVRDGKEIFVARCVDGKVIKVEDKRAYAARLRPRKSDGDASSEPTVEGFTDPDDFYYWYRDDFFDFEEAENYYYSHGGK